MCPCRRGPYLPSSSITPPRYPQWWEGPYDREHLSQPPLPWSDYERARPGPSVSVGIGRLVCHIEEGSPVAAAAAAMTGLMEVRTGLSSRGAPAGPGPLGLSLCRHLGGWTGWGWWTQARGGESHQARRLHRRCLMESGSGNVPPPAVFGCLGVMCCLMRLR